MKKEICLIVLLTGDILISEIEQVGSDIGEPDCKLVSPFILDKIDKKNITPWMEEYTKDKEFMISSDKIITLVEPNGKLLDDYLDLTK